MVHQTQAPSGWRITPFCEGLANSLTNTYYVICEHPIIIPLNVYNTTNCTVDQTPYYVNMAQGSKYCH